MAVDGIFMMVTKKKTEVIISTTTTYCIMMAVQCILTDAGRTLKNDDIYVLGYTCKQGNWSYQYGVAKYSVTNYTWEQLPNIT